MDSIKPKSLLVLSFVSLVILIKVSALASDRAIHLKDKCTHAQKSLVFDGSFVHNVGNLKMNITNWGFLGSLPESQFPMSDSPSAQWPAGSGVEYLYAAGIWIGALMNGVPVVSTGYPETEFYPPSDPIDIIYRSFEGERGGDRYPGPADDDQDGKVDEDWLNGRDDDADGWIDEDFAAIGKQMFSCWYTDDQEYASNVWPEHTPLNLNIRQETYQWSEDDFNNFVGVHYRITNQGTSFLEDVYIGIYADLDAGPRSYGYYHLDDQVGYWEGIWCSPRGNFEVPVKLRVAYVYDDDGDGGKAPGYFGVVVLGHTTDYFGVTAPSSIQVNAFRIFQGLRSFESGGDPTNDYERYLVLSTPEKHKDTEIPGDYRIFIGAGPFGTLSPDSTITLDIAYVCGEGLDEMLQNAANAMAVYQGVWFNRTNNDGAYFGRETPVPGPLDSWEIDPCNLPGVFVDIKKGEVVWSNLDCWDELWAWNHIGCYKNPEAVFKDYQTGVSGKETRLYWITGSAPTPPNMRIVPGDNKIIIFWDNMSEVVPDVLTMEYDFEGYQIWRADEWHRPYGTSVLSGPSDNLWSLLATRDLINGIHPDINFKEPYSIGGWEYEPLEYLEDREEIILVFEENILRSPSEPALCPFGLSRQECDTLEALARYNLGFEGGRQYYKFVDTMVKNGLPYFYSIIAYDHQTKNGVPVGPGRYNTPASNFAYAVPRSESQAPEQFREDKVYVVPNPATRKNLEPWMMEPNNDDPTGIKIEFRNLPRCINTVRIFTIAGDLVQVLHHDGRSGNGSLPWDLVSRNGQDITSGVYIFNVEPGDSRFPRTTGKFVVIR